MSTDIEDGSSDDEEAVESGATGEDADADDTDPAERRCGISLRDHPDE